MTDRTAEESLQWSANEGRALPRQSRWLLMYLLLAGFVIVSLLFGLVMHHRLAQTFGDAVAQNEAWTMRREAFRDVELHIGAIADIHVDAIQFAEFQRARARLQAEFSAFETSLRKARKVAADLPESPSSILLGQYLDRIEVLARELSSQNDKLGDLAANPDAEAALQRMTAIERIVGELIVIAADLDRIALRYQLDDIRTQALSSGEMRRVEFLFGGLTVLMGIGLIFYGMRLSRHMIAYENAQVAFLSALQADKEMLEFAHRKASESEARFAGIIDLAMEAIISVDERRRIKLFNRGAEVKFRRSAESVMGQEIEILMPERLRASHAAHFDNFARSEDVQRSLSQRREILALRGDGTEFPAEASVSKLVLGERTTYTIVLRDATPQKKAEEATEARTKFFAAASHDLRQPLHAMSMYLPMLERRIVDPESRDLVGAVRSSCEAMRSLLDSLLDISKLDAGVVTPQVEAVAVSDIFELMATEFGPLAAERSLELRVVPSSHWIATDLALLLRILRNLLSNAIRYTDRGRIVMGLRRHGDRLRIEVHDSGIGVPDHLQGRIFEEFYQIGNPERDRHRGLGLGLAIVKRLALLLDIRVSLRSIPGRGTCFALDLPVAQDEGPAMQGTVSTLPDLAGVHIVLVEDDPDVRDATARMLADEGCAVTAAESGGAALAALAHSESPPDFILADLRLRGSETGVQAVLALRSAIGRDLPAIIMTGDTDPERLRRVAESGIALFHKPVVSERLRVAISELLWPGSGPHLADATGTGARLEVGV